MPILIFKFISEHPVYFIIYRNSKLFQDSQQENTNKKRKKRNTQSGKNNRCERKFDPTNGLILTSVIGKDANKMQQVGVDARLKFKKEKVCFFKGMKILEIAF